MSFPYTINSNTQVAPAEYQSEIYKYLYNVISGCGGFIKSKGYVLINYDAIVLMSFDRAFLSIIPIKPVNIVYVSEIKMFVKAKDKPESFIQDTYIIGAYQLYTEMHKKYMTYNAIGNSTSQYSEDTTACQIYQEDLMSNLEGFDQAVSSTSLSWIKFNDGERRYKICVSKTIFPLNKGDHSSISIFKVDDSNTRILRYRIHKNKLKVYADIFTKQFILDSTD